MEDDWLSSAKQLGELFRNHKGRIVVYTGAGISTSANIPDYRGTHGLWTRQRLSAPNSSTSTDRPSGSTGSKRRHSSSAQVPLKLRLPEATQAIPTYTHMAIRTLVQEGYVRHVVSQNVDGLHVRSGLPRQQLSELHGNLFFEQCMACRAIILRDFDVAETTGRNQHLTGRICPQCRRLRTPDYLIVCRALQTVADKSKTTKKNGRLSSVRASKAAATRLCRGTEPSTKHSSINQPASSTASLPLLRDVIVHFHERQPEAGLRDIYRVGAAIEAIHGRKPIQASVALSLNSVPPTTDSVNLEDLAKPLLTSPWFQRMLPAFQAHYSTTSSLSETDIPTDIDFPATLIVVMGSSLSVLRSYGFLWPQGLGRCLNKSHRSADLNPAERNESQCRLAIVNLQPTCKDGLSDVLIRAPCDQVLQVVMRDCLGLTVPPYDPRVDDPLVREAVQLLPDEEHTRTRPSIPFHLFV